MANGEPTTIYGDGEQTRDFVYVGDVVRALLAAVGRDGGVFNVGTGRETTVRELHERCGEVSGRRGARGRRRAAGGRPEERSRRVAGAVGARLGARDEPGRRPAETWAWVAEERGGAART